MSSVTANSLRPSSLVLAPNPYLNPNYKYPMLLDALAGLAIAFLCWLIAVAVLSL
jgi:hypothetical protein